MRSTIRLEPAASGDQWDALADSLGGTQFHSWGWLQLTEDLFGVQVERLLVLLDGDPIGVLPLARAPWRPTSFPLPFPFLGPLVPAQHLSSTLSALQAWQLRHGLLLASVDLPPGAGVTAAALHGQAVTVVEDASIVVDLAHRSEEQVVANYSQSRRRSVKKALAAGATVRDALPGELTAMLGPVLDEAYGARGVPSPYPDDTGAKVEAWAAGRSDVQILTALVHDEPAGVLVLLIGSDTAWCWVAGSFRRFRGAGPNVLLYHEQLLRALRAGATSMDLVGSVDGGIREFKMAYGGHSAPYLRLQSRVGPPVAWRAMSRARSLARRRAVPAAAV